MDNNAVLDFMVRPMLGHKEGATRATPPRHREAPFQSYARSRPVGDATHGKVSGGAQKFAVFGGFPDQATLRVLENLTVGAL